MKSGARTGLLAAIVVAIFLAALYVLQWSSGSSSDIRLGISPYQDTAIPVITSTEGIYAAAGLDIALQTVPWENIVPSLASRGRTIDVGIGSINTFLPRAAAVNAGSDDPVVFYAPLYVFKGASLIARSNAGLVPFRDLVAANGGSRATALTALMNAIKGKRVGYPSGTPYEQMFFEGLRSSGLKKTDFDIRDVQLADALPALLSGALDVAAAGVTQRTEALRRGHIVLIESEDLGLAEIIGLMTTKKFLETHARDLEAIRIAWFETIRAMKRDPKRYTQSVIDYLAQNASTKYTYDEYMASLGAQEFPATESDAGDLFLTEKGRFYWRKTWDVVNNYLIDTQKIQEPVPYTYFVGPNEH